MDHVRRRGYVDPVGEAGMVVEVQGHEWPCLKRLRPVPDA